MSKAGYYAWRKRPPSEHSRRDEQLRVKIREAHDRSRRTYGSPRVHAELAAQDERVGRKRVARLMREQDLVARRRKRFKCTTMSDHDQPVNERWVGDTTELLIGQSAAKLYLAVILDLFSRYAVGWAVSAVNDRHLTIKALEMALRRRNPGAGLVHHSDQGSTYASEDYQRVLQEAGIVCSMSRRGNCQDNAVVESWNSTLKSELGERFESYGDAKEKLFDYIEAYYNPKRRHSALGYMSPAEYERSARMRLVA